MVADLWMRLRSKELQAYGNCVAPIISNGPILIPLHMFEFAPPRELSSSDNIENFGWRFEGVKVCSARDDALEAQIHGLIMSDFIESRIGEAAKRGGGAKNRYGDVREILIRLFNERPKVRGESAANLLASFNKLYIEAYSSDDIKRGAISETSLRQHLKAYRQELVKIGNN